MMSDKPICPLCDQRIYGGCMCISAEYSVRIRELEAKLDAVKAERDQLSARLNNTQAIAIGEQELASEPE